MTRQRKRRWQRVPERTRRSMPDERLDALTRLAQALKAAPRWPALLDALHGPVRAALGAAAIHLVPGMDPALGGAAERTRVVGGETAAREPASVGSTTARMTDSDTLGALIIDFPIDRCPTRRDARFIETVGALLGLALVGASPCAARRRRWVRGRPVASRRRMKRTRTPGRRQRRAAEPSPAA